MGFGPLSGNPVELTLVGLVLLGDGSLEGVIGVRSLEKLHDGGEELRDGLTGLPVAEHLEANIALVVSLLTDVGMVDLGRELHLLRPQEIQP